MSDRAMERHPRVCLHQVVCASASTDAFVALCRSIGVRNMTLATPLLLREPGGVARLKSSIAEGGPRASVINHPFAVFPNLADDGGEASDRLLRAIELTAELGARSIYMLTGGRGALSWEQAADRFATLLQPGLNAARASGVTLMIENASAFNIDIHIAHTLADTIRLAEMADIGVCIDLHTCWGEAGLERMFQQAMPRLGLVQVSDYGLGDRTAPCRAVPGDGAIPLKPLISAILALGYQGLFDIELVGPRIEAEGAGAAAARSASWLSTVLTDRDA